MKTLLEKALRQIGLEESDVCRFMRPGKADLIDIDSFVELIEGNGLEWSDFGFESKDDFVNKVNATTKDEVNFMPDHDLVIIDGVKYLIEYVL